MSIKTKKDYPKLQDIFGFNPYHPLSRRARYLSPTSNEQYIYQVGKPYSRFLERLEYSRWDTEPRRDGTALYWRWH